MRMPVVALALVVAAAAPASAEKLPRLEAKAMFEQPLAMGTSTKAVSPLPAVKGQILFEEAFAVSQKTYALASEIAVSEPRSVSFQKGTGFAAWSFGGEVRFCRTQANMSVVTRPDLFLCIRDVNGDGLGDSAITWKAARAQESEARLALPASFEPSAPSERYRAKGYSDGHLYRMANRLRIAGVSGAGVEMIWEFASARPQDKDDPKQWPTDRVNKVKVREGETTVIGPFTVLAEKAASGQTLVRLLAADPWLVVSEGGRAINVNGARFDRVFNWAATPCTSTGAKAAGLLTAGGILQRGLIKAAAGCDSVRPFFFEEWERPTLGL